MFKQYIHVERFGNQEVEGIELGEVYIFPKLDGTNGSIWCEGSTIMAGSRNRPLSIGNDNAGFYNWVLEQDNIKELFCELPQIRLFGEWLVPHTFKGYREEAWRQFYVFDVLNDYTDEYLPYDTYAPVLEKYRIKYIPPLAKIKNGSYENFLKMVESNKFLCPDDATAGEGICIKNYGYRNRFDRYAVAKIVRQEFKDEHSRLMGAPEINQGLMNEERILEWVNINHLVDKTYAKICNEKGGWSSKCIPELFGRVYHDVVREELWDALASINYGAINFRTLKALIINGIKKQRPDLFA